MPWSSVPKSGGIFNVNKPTHSNRKASRGPAIDSSKQTGAQFTTVKRHLFAPGNGADHSRQEGEASEHGTQSLLSKFEFSRNKLETQLAEPFNPGRNSRRI